LVFQSVDRYRVTKGKTVDKIMAHSKFNIEGYVNDLAKTVLDTQPVAGEESVPVETVLSGLVIELWSDPAGRLFIVADEDDAQRLGELRGSVYTGAELRRVVQIGDPATVLEIHEWKRTFSGHLREVRRTSTRQY
jgi:hypothetical protein